MRYERLYQVRDQFGDYYVRRLDHSAELNLCEVAHIQELRPRQKLDTGDRLMIPAAELMPTLMFIRHPHPGTPGSAPGSPGAASALMGTECGEGLVPAQAAA